MITIRDAADADRPALKRLYRCFVDEMSRFNADDGNSDEEIMSWIDISLTGSGAIWIAESGGGISGLARVQHKKRGLDNGETVDYVKLNDLYVSPESRRKGIARLLVKACIGWAKNACAAEMILNVYENNQAARILYGSFGFTEDSFISENRIRMKYSLRNDR